MQIARRFHHQVKDLPPRTIIDVEAADLASVLDALWGEIDRANAAEDRLAGKPVTKRVPYLRVFRAEDQQPA
jgi:hypothetical protein